MGNSNVATGQDCVRTKPFEWLRHIAVRNGYLKLVPMLNGPGGYMVVDKLYTYNFDVSCPDVMSLSNHPIQNLKEYFKFWDEVQMKRHDLGSPSCPSC
eukprot:602707-Karenia_brevis.AAC.1